MASFSVTPLEIIEAYKAANGANILVPDFSKVKTSTNNKTKTYYIPINVRLANGKMAAPMLKFTRQILASNAKLPYGVERDEARDVRVVYRTITADDFNNSEYAASAHDALMQQNKEFIQALDIIADEYLKLSKNSILTYKGTAFKLNSNRTINCFRQSERNATNQETENADENGKIPLANPLYRFKIPADTATKRLGVSIADRGFQPCVFDAKRTSAEAQEKGLKIPVPVVAQIKTKTGYKDLTIFNAEHFITYMSLTGGIIQFDSVCISKSGLSLMCRVREINVWRHRPLQNPTMSEADLNDMAAFAPQSTGDDEDDYDEDAPVSTPEPSNKKTNKSTASNHKKLLDSLADDDDEDGDTSNIQEPSVSDEDDAEDEPEQENEEPEEENEEPEEEEEEEEAPPPPKRSSKSSSSKRK